MKNFNRCSSQRTLTWVARIHSHAYIYTVTTTLCKVSAQLLQNLISNCYLRYQSLCLEVEELWKLVIGSGETSQCLEQTGRTIIFCMKWQVVNISLSWFMLRFYLTGDIAQWLESWNSNPKTLSSIPWRGSVSTNFCVPPSQLLCRHVCAWPPIRVYGTHPNLCAHLKIPYPSVIKE